MRMNIRFKSTLETLTKKIPKSLRWGFYAGIAAFFYGSDREPTDFDIIVHESDVQTITNALKEHLISSPKWTKKDIFREHLARFKLNEYEIEVISDLIIIVEKHRYTISVDEKMLNKIRRLEFNNMRVPVVAPEDVIVFKAIAQRGEDKGKYDVQDIEAILGNQKIDLEYLKERSRKTGSHDRVFKLLKSLNFL